MDNELDKVRAAFAKARRIEQAREDLFWRRCGMAAFAIGVALLAILESIT